MNLIQLEILCFVHQITYRIDDMSSKVYRNLRLNTETLKIYFKRHKKGSATLMERFTYRIDDMSLMTILLEAGSFIQV